MDNAYGVGLRVSRKYGNMGFMKTTVELPDAAFRTAKSFAASRGISLRQFLTEALIEKLDRSLKTNSASPDKDPPWMLGFGELADLKEENQRVLAKIEEEFETLDPQDVI